MKKNTRAIYTEEVSTEHNIYPNMTVYDCFTDGEPNGWKIIANDGYVFYDTTENNTESDPVTGEEIPVIYYYTLSRKPKRYNWDNFHYVAVLRSTVDENYIFGGGNTNQPEIM